jgi:uncharacterized protein (DUF2147 family)
MKKLIGLILFCCAIGVSAQNMVGKWKTIDDNTGKERSIVEIYKKGDKYYGKILSLYRAPGEEQDPICDECDEDDSRYNQKIIGMEFIQDMEYDADDMELEDGTILDPENGSIYDCKIWVNKEGNLQVRGYIAFLYRTQTWLPYKG